MYEDPVDLAYMDGSSSAKVTKVKTRKQGNL